GIGCGRPRVGRAAVGAHVHCVAQAIYRVIIVGGVGDARLGRGRWIAQGAGGRLIVVALAVHREDDVVVLVVGDFDLLQHGVAGDVAGVAPGRIAAGVAAILRRHAVRAVVGQLGRQPARIALFEHVAAVVVPDVGV